MNQSYRHTKPVAWVQIDLKAVRHNFSEIRKLAFQQLEPRINREVDILSVVKADAYGHGMVEVAHVIEKEGGRFFAVSNVEEAIELREAGCKKRIVLFETTLPELAPQIIKYDLTPGVCTMELARAIDRLARRLKKKIPVHVKIDTGMGRLGVWHEEAVDFVRALNRLKNIRVEGLFTHFPVADSDEKFTEKQMDDFSKLVAQLIKDQIPFRYIHAANSMGLLGYKNRFFNLTRPGVMLYGLYPADVLRKKIALKPVMSVKSRVLFTKTIHKGRGISYGHTFRTTKDTRVAVLAIGYSDGYSRAFSNKARVLLNGVFCPVLGRVTMDQTIVDISKAGVVRIGDEAVVIGRQAAEEITTDHLAAWAGTINYEIVCNLGNRLPRIYVK
ncbi:MAG: alanine racemase [Candidatus Omnitrophica bacterium]|nr:alanine racemase [Candidatus Omnitrophota bacterium]